VRIRTAQAACAAVLCASLLLVPTAGSERPSGVSGASGDAASSEASWRVDTAERATCIPYLWESSDDGIGVAEMLSHGWHTSGEDGRAFALYPPNC
jgi:hypothetical protein